MGPPSGGGADSPPGGLASRLRGKRTGDSSRRQIRAPEPGDDPMRQLLKIAPGRRRQSRELNLAAIILGSSDRRPT